MSPAKRAVLYARVSTPRQAELYSLDYQLDQERAYTAEMNLSVVAELDEDKSGRKLEARDKLEEACAMLEQDEADILVVWKFDRLHRNYVNSVLLRDRIRRAGKEIHYAQSRTVSGKTARQRLPEDLQYIMAEIEADDIAERTAQGRINKIKSGKWFGTGKPPYGYTKVGQGREASMVINEEQAEVIRQVFDWYTYGEGEYGPLTTQEIASKLTAIGIPTPQDTHEKHTHVKQRAYAQWGRYAINSLLRQSAYNGTFYHKIQGGRHAIAVPRIVSEATFTIAQNKLDEGRQLANRGALYDYLVGRRIKCECGYSMYSGVGGHVHTSPDGTKKQYRYYHYRCAGRVSKVEMVRTCDMPRAISCFNN